MKHENIFKEIDNATKRMCKEFIKLAESKGYKYFSEYVFEEYRERTYKSISKEIKDFSGILYTQGAIYAIIKRVRTKIEDAKFFKANRSL